MPLRAPLRVVDNPRHAEPARFRDALHCAARALSQRGFALDAPELVNAARVVLARQPHDATGTAPRGLANAELCLAAMLLRDARRHGAQRADRLGAWRAKRAAQPR